MKNGQMYLGQFAYDTIHGNGTMHTAGEEKKVEKGVFVKGQFKSVV